LSRKYWVKSNTSARGGGLTMSTWKVRFYWFPISFSCPTNSFVQLLYPFVLAN